MKQRIEFQYIGARRAESVKDQRLDVTDQCVDTVVGRIDQRFKLIHQRLQFTDEAGAGIKSVTNQR